MLLSAGHRFGLSLEPLQLLLNCFLVRLFERGLIVLCIAACDCEEAAKEGL